MGEGRKNSKYPVKRRGTRPLRVRETAQAYATDTVGVRELRQNLSVYLDEVKQGRSLLVTEHGRHVAVLGPPPATLSVLDRLVAEGKMTRPTRRVTDLRPPLEVKLDKPLSQIIIEMREEDPR